MSTQLVSDVTARESAAELTMLGKRLEILRIERGVSKQHLARHAGTSRQQLWRVMTGKSELTKSLRERLATALSIEPASLASGVSGALQAFTLDATSSCTTSALEAPPFAVSDYFTRADLLTATLRTMPTGDGGRRLKRALLNALEDMADESGRVLSQDYSDIHRKVLSGEL